MGDIEEKTQQHIYSTALGLIYDDYDYYYYFKAAGVQTSTPYQMF